MQTVLAQGGKVKLNSEDLYLMRQEDIAKKIEYVPQMTNDFFSGTVMDIVYLTDKNYSELSGGQKQKSAYSRELA